jgi:uroporphyrin-III C-methyltransferase
MKYDLSSTPARGHAKPGSTGTDWRALATTARQARLTLVIYMGVSGAATIQRELMYGLHADTPAAIIQNATLPHQRHTVCTLAELASTIETGQFSSPSVIVVGDVLQGLPATGLHGSTADDATPRWRTA